MQITYWIGTMVLIMLVVSEAVIAKLGKKSSSALKYINYMKIKGMFSDFYIFFEQKSRTLGPCLDGS